MVDYWNPQNIDEFAAGIGEGIYTKMLRRINRAHPQDFDDFSQNVYLKAFRNFSSYKVGTNFGGWLCQTATNQVITEYRKRQHRFKRETNLDANLTHAYLRSRGQRLSARQWKEDSKDEFLAVIATCNTSMGIEDDLIAGIDAQRASCFFPEIEKIPDENQYRSALVLCDIEGKTYEEAARHLRVKVGTIMSRLHRARNILAHNLAEEYRKTHGYAQGEPVQDPVAATGEIATKFGLGRNLKCKSSRLYKALCGEEKIGRVRSHYQRDKKIKEAA